MRIAELLSGHPRDALTFVTKRRNIKGKRRTISKPSDELRAVHENLVEVIEKLVPGISQSPVRGALDHQLNRYFFQLDLKDAYPSVSASKLAAQLLLLDPWFGEAREVIDFVERYCMVPNLGLAQGAPCSPLLFELVARSWLDEPIGQLLAHHQEHKHAPITYTRYADDLNFSSAAEIPRYVRGQIRYIVGRAGFRVNEKKTSPGDRRTHPVVVTGVQLGRKRVTHTKGFYDTLERQLEVLLSNSLLDVALPQLRGRIAWFKELEDRFDGAIRTERVNAIKEKLALCEPILAQKCPPKPQGKMRYRFDKQWLDELRQKVPVVPYVRSCMPQHQWAPKATGVRAPCPFCRARGQSLTASPILQTFHCHKCKAHGDVIAFAMRFYGWNFLVAVVQLAKLAQLELPESYYKRLGKPVQLAFFPAAGAKR